MGNKKEDDIINANQGGRAIKIIVTCLIVVIMIITLCRCFYTVNEQKNAVVTQFGSIVKVNTAGMYFKPPWQSVQPNLTAGVACIDGWSVRVWQL